MEVRQQESYLKEAGQLGGFFQSSERGECSVSEAGGQEGFVRPGAGGSGWGNSESLLFRAWDLLGWGRAVCAGKGHLCSSEADHARLALAARDPVAMETPRLL